MALGGLTTDLAIVVAATVMAVSGFWLARRVVAGHLVRGQNEAAGFIYTGTGIIYAVVLGLVIAAVWGGHARADDVTLEESAALLGLYRDAEVLPEPARTNIDAAIKNYLQLVIEDEWPLLAHGHASPKAEAALSLIWKDYRELNPQTPWAVALGAESFKQLNEVSAQRSHRLVLAESRLPAILWFFLIAGGAIMVCFTYFFHTDNVRAHAAMIGIATIVVVSALYIVYALDEPYGGPLAVGPQAFQHTLELTAAEKHNAP
jgi:hypothetical protein